ncbi:MAG: NAD-dependent epimerase/dehydratase family protein [bacterium]
MNTALDRTLQSPVLVTGAGGFIGGRLAERLATQGLRVRGLVRQTEQAPALAERGIEPVFGDLTRPQDLGPAVSGCAVVFHCAGWMGEPPSWEAASAVNREGTRHLLEACLAAGVGRFIHVSTISVYGPTPAMTIDEQTSLWPLGYYRESKIAAEREVEAASRRGLETVVVRPGQVFGPGDRRLAGMVLRWLSRGLPVLVDGGWGFCHPLYVDNLVDALLAAAGAEDAVGQVFNLADCDMHWRQFLGHFARMTGRPLRSVPSWVVRVIARGTEGVAAITRRPAWLPSDEVAYFLRTSRYSRARAQEVLQWAPRVPMREAMEATEAWLRRAGLLSVSFPTTEVVARV